MNSPSRNSPKLPHPIFLPTRKFGPTMRTPLDELTEWRAEYMFDDPLRWAFAPVAAAAPEPLAAPLKIEKGEKDHEPIN